MHGAVDPHLGALPDTRPVEDGGPRGQEGVVPDNAAHQVGPRPHHHVVSDPRRVPLGAAHDGVLHHDAVFTYLHRPALGGEHDAEHDAGTLAHRHVAAEDGIWRDVGGVVHVRASASMFQEHTSPPLLT